MKITDVQSQASLLRKILPIQSLNQLASYLLFTLVGVLVFELFLKVLGFPSATPIVLVGAFLGSSVVLGMVLPGHLQLDSDNPTEIAQALDAIRFFVAAYGYKSTQEIQPRTFEFSTNWIWFLKWRENTIRADVGALSIRLLGPVFILRILRHRLVVELIES